MSDSKKTPASLSEAMRWVSEVTTVALEMAIPPIAGNYADARYHTSPWLAVLGALLGMALGMSHFIRMIRRSDNPPKR